VSVTLQAKLVSKNRENEMTLSVAEMYLVVWASFMTLLYFISKHDAKNFKQFTVYKLRQVAKGKAKVVDDGESVQIVDC
jgi:hypothetical protein